jgi:hypothetical protein
MIIDAWAQHPTLRHLQDPMFESLRRWTKNAVPQWSCLFRRRLQRWIRAGVDKALISAWYAPRNVMISNDEVAECVAQARGAVTSCSRRRYPSFCRYRRCPT